MKEIANQIVERAGRRPAPPSTDILQKRNTEALALFEVLFNQDVLVALVNTTNTSGALFPLGEFQRADINGATETLLLQITQKHCAKTSQETDNLQAKLQAKVVIQFDNSLLKIVEKTQGRVTKNTTLDYLSLVSPEYKWKVIPPDNSRSTLATQCIYAGTRSLNVEALAAAHYENLDAIGQKILDILNPPTEATK